MRQRAKKEGEDEVEELRTLCEQNRRLKDKEAVFQISKPCARTYISWFARNASQLVVTMILCQPPV